MTPSSSNIVCQSIFIYQLMHKRVPLKNIKIYIKTAPTCFGLITIIRSVLFDLAEVTVVKIIN
jgi:hypothetical protein